jgi:hypothetical protein
LTTFASDGLPLGSALQRITIKEYALAGIPQIALAADLIMRKLTRALTFCKNKMTQLCF